MNTNSNIAAMTERVIHRFGGAESGQATAEYALVLLAAAALAGAVLAWAVSSGGIARLMDVVVDNLIDQADG